MRALIILMIVIITSVSTFGQVSAQLRQEIIEQIRKEEVLERVAKERVQREIAFQFHLDRIEQGHAHRMRINELRHQHRVEMMRSYHFHRGRTKWGQDWHLYMRHRSQGGNGAAYRRSTGTYSRFPEQPSFGHHGR